MRTIHVYRAARNYFIDGIYWGDDAEGVRFYLQVTGVPPRRSRRPYNRLNRKGHIRLRQVGVLTLAIRVSA